MTPTTHPNWFRRHTRDFALAGFSLIITLLLCEVAVRLLTIRSDSGQVYFGDLALKPYAIDTEPTQKDLDEYFEAGDSSYLMYDDTLGWTIRPNATSRNGEYASNSQGLRADRDFALEPAPGVVRIALLGDSFTHGSDVTLDKAWSTQLETLLIERGVNAEVINFGVGGYGMDQALLRWREVAINYQPDIVIFGFVADDVNRNLTMFRRFCTGSKTDVPFFKPRFVLEGDALRLVNSPTPPPDQIVATLQGFPDSALAEYEYFYQIDDYASRWYLNSRMIALGATLTDRDQRPSTCVELRETPGAYARDGEPAHLAFAIVDQFQREVTATGAEFLVLHMPVQEDVEKLHRGEAVYYQAILDELIVRYHMIDPTFDLPSDSTLANYYTGVGHYSKSGGAVIAQAAADALLEMLGGD
jgi:hypothetical protein